MRDRLYEAWKRCRSVMVQMPMGTGKTHLMAEVIRERMAEGVLIVAHRIELIAQISETLDKFGVAHGIIDRTTKDVEKVTRDYRVVVASIQTLARRTERWGQAPSNSFAAKTSTQGLAPAYSFAAKTSTQGLAPAGGFGTVIVDEAHHAVAKTYRMLWERWPEAKFLGLTATPCRLNEAGFTDLFDTLLQSYSIQEFIDRGWLSDFEYISVTPDNMLVEQIAGLKKRGVDGDYQTKEMATVMDSAESIAHLYQSYAQYAKGKKGIVYAINREHAQHIAAYYKDKGVNCEVIDAETPAEERARIIQAYKTARWGQAPSNSFASKTSTRGLAPASSFPCDVLINVDIFSEGFDCPEVEFIQLARPTLSLSKYLQQVGRGMRINSKKAYVMILDQVGMYQTFGMPTVERDWSLMFRGKLAGKGQQGGDHRFVIREEPELSLLNLEMVRIKRHGEKSTGMELFIQNGKYGVLNDGKVVCQAEFEKVKRLDNPYFAMGVYPYYVYKNRVDIIGMDGRVMRPGIYGSVKQDHDVFIGQDINGRADYWDAKGGRHYKSMPTFERIQRFEVAIDGEQIYMRQSSKEWDKPFAKDNVLVREKDYVIFGNKLVFLNDTGNVYEVCGYEDNVYVYIKWHEMSDNDYQYACVGPKGTIVSYLRELPGRLMPRPTKLSKMGLIPFFTSKAELGVRSRK